MGRPKRAVVETPADAAVEEGPSSPKQQKVDEEVAEAEPTKKEAPKKKGGRNSIAPAIEHARKYLEGQKDGIEIKASELLKDYENKHPCYNYFSNKLKEIMGKDLTIVRAKGKNARDHTLVYKKN